ncbi:hypothetical protein Tco_0766514 [Tanacetum coccineum]
MMSFGGRLTLANSVLGSLPLYYFSMFRVCCKTESWPIDSPMNHLINERGCVADKGSWANTDGVVEIGSWLRNIRGRGQMEMDAKWRWEFFGQRSFRISLGEDSRRGKRRSRNDMEQVGT